ncbi:hypothetical protein C0J52_00445 [Blattella germanica]|nr:hypothetical protein C0J52_00445 [Blattella germanica]
MSLVAYGSSDESENESGNEEDSAPSAEPEPEVLEKSPKHSDINQSTHENKKDTSSSSLFSSLPSPKTKTSGFSLYTEDTLIDNHKHLQKKQPVKIIIPSLSEFKDDDEPEPVKKKLKPSAKGSGLFSLLPAPKNLTLKETKRPLVPNVLTKKPPTNPPVVKPKLEAAPKVGSKADSNKKSTPLINYGDSEDESDGEGDFFSLKVDRSDVAVNNIGALGPETHSSTSNGSSQIDDNSSNADTTVLPGEEGETNDQPLTFSSKFKPSPWATGMAQGGPTLQEQWQNDLQRLCGRRGKRQQQEMQLIDVSGDAIMPDPKEWLTKQLTQEQTKMHSHSHRKNDGPTTQQRRKHQITYLAFQAKENELELKNQWSQNRMSRKQTQSKYGF